ncbi:MAG: hypothetical protein WBC44_04485 [Planctomycetaceae bacterium]
MSHWYAKARDTLTQRRPGVQEPEPFSRPCVCGETITGERLPQARQVACPNCGRDWFILPRDPYPDAKRRRRSKSKTPKRPSWLRRRSDRKATTSPPAETDDVSRVNDAFPVSLASKTRSEPAATPVSTDRPNRPRWSDVKQTGRDWLRREARPIRLVLAGCAAALAVTGFWLWHRARIDGASATIVQVVPQAEQALNDRDFDTAEQLLAQAVDAVDLLGAEDDTAARIRQRHRELVALNHLAGKTPFDLAVEAGLHDANPTSWETEFQASYAGRWVVFDVPLNERRPATAQRPPSDAETAEPPARTPRSVIPIELALAAGSTPVRFEIDAGLFQTLKSPDRVIFAAQYASWQFQREAGSDSVWVVRFHPETSFLWASPDTLADLGIDPDGEPRSVLKNQAAALGVPVEPNDDTGQTDPDRSGRE